jgi:hypothetical protein
MRDETMEIGGKMNVERNEERNEDGGLGMPETPTENNRQTKLEEFGFVFGKKGDEEMTVKRGQVEECNDECKVVGMMPVLETEEYEQASSEQATEWGEACFTKGIGAVWNVPEYGIALQVADERRLRLLTVVNHSHCLWTVAMVKATMSCMGLELVIDGSTVLAEYREGVLPVTGMVTQDEDEDEGVPGMEVV